MTAVVVLGTGFVGRSVAKDLEASATTVELIGRSDLPGLSDRDGRGRTALLERITDLGATALVNTAGLLRGTDDEMRDANVAWPAWLANEVLAGTAVRLVHLGSASEYGDPGSPDPTPETRPAAPSGIYGESKWAGSSAVLAARARGLDAVVARGFNLVGPNLPAVSPLHQFLTDVRAAPAEGGEIEVWWPDTIRDFILMTDLSRAVARLALVEHVPDIVNLCSGVGISFAEVVRAMAAAAHKSVDVVSLNRPGIPAVVGDPARLIETTGIRPRMSAAILAEHADL